ncbi:MAG: methanogen output domain 1-containing protein [Gammaproteobacteria bacterium]|jgi:predicted ArsR family transcriptional regulator
MNVNLELEGFLRNLIGHLSGTLQDVIGIDEASGFISIVGRNIGHEINQQYHAALNTEKLNREQLADVLVDLKQRIKGDFSIVSEDEEKIVLKTTSCPFGKHVLERPSLCMMTSNVFGTIAADNLGYAKVALEETIAQGAAGCRIVIYLHSDTKSGQVDGIEYFGQ